MVRFVNTPRPSTPPLAFKPSNLARSTVNGLKANQRKHTDPNFLRLMTRASELV